MIVPSPYGLAGDAFIRSLIDSGYIGKLREVHVHSLNDSLADPKTPMSWRQNTRYSGFNMLTLGIVYESVLRWVAPAIRVSAYASKINRVRFDPEQGRTRNARQCAGFDVAVGRCGVYRFSGVVWNDASMGVALYGDRARSCMTSCTMRSGVGSGAAGDWSRCRSPTRSAAIGRSRRISLRRFGASDL